MLELNNFNKFCIMIDYHYSKHVLEEYPNKDFGLGMVRLASKSEYISKSFQFAEKLKNTGDKDDWLQGRKIEPKMRTFVPVIVRGKESEGVKFWGFGKTIYSELLSIISDPDYGDITDLTSGRDIDIEFTKPTMQGEYPKTSIRVKPNVTPATEDKAIAEKIMNQPKIEDIYPEPSYDELKELLQTWLNPENADADAPESVAAPTADTNSTDEPNAPSDEVKTNVADAFDKLFND